LLTSFGGGVELDFLDAALGVVAAAGVAHLREDLDHGGDADLGDALGVVVGEVVGGRGLVA
jgi:hypothetical protein